MTRMSLPPGFRFHPTDVELIMYYLKRKSLGKKLRFEAIADVNIYKYSPWDLPDKSCLKNKDLEWFFFCPISRKYASGARFCRATETGYWKATGKDRAVIHNEQSVGMVKTLVYHQGHAPKGERTDWVMHEYRILEKELADAGVDQAAYVLVKVFKKSGPGPKNGAQYGAPFNEEEWNSDDDDEVEIFTETLQPSASLPHSAVANNNPSLITSTYEYGGTSNVSQQPPDYSPLSPVTRNNINSVDTSTYEYGGTSYVSQQPPGYSPLSAVTRNNINSVDTNTQSAGFHCNSVGTNSFVLSGTSNISLQPLSAVTHNNYYVDTTTQFTSLPTTHNTHNNNSLITSTFLPGGPSTVMSSANDVPLGKEVELESLLAMFTEQDLPAMPSDFNDVNLVNGEEFMELDDIYADLGDLPLPDWDELGRMI